MGARVSEGGCVCGGGFSSLYRECLLKDFSSSYRNRLVRDFSPPHPNNPQANGVAASQDHLHV